MAVVAPRPALSQQVVIDMFTAATLPERGLYICLNLAYMYVRV